jgi:hypothetical protein
LVGIAGITESRLSQFFVLSAQVTMVSDARPEKRSLSLFVVNLILFFVAFHFSPSIINNNNHKRKVDSLQYNVYNGHHDTKECRSKRRFWPYID